MKILIASAEVHPYSKTGGLADMTGALSKALVEAGCEVTLVTPLYAGIAARYPELTVGESLQIPMASQTMSGRVRILPINPNFTINFIEQPRYFERPGLYQENGVDYPDNAERFAFFCKAILQVAQAMAVPPDIIHLHDWQCGLVPSLLHHGRSSGKWMDPPRVCFTIHNLAYQGNFPPYEYSWTNLPRDFFHLDSLEFYGQMSFLKAGIVFTNVITTVSPRYSREILTREYGCGMEGILQHRQGALVGILNGVDYSEWKTTGNPHLRHAYSLSRLKGKEREKIRLQNELGLAPSPGTPLFGNIGRMVEQKGIDLLIGALEEMLDRDIQMVCLGSGQAEYEQALLALAGRHPAKMAVRVGFNTALSHQIEAGCDFYLMPSRFEPCGLNQMYSLRYGTIPIVRATGGLDDSVIDITEALDRANGIKFHDYSVGALVKSIHKALALFREPLLLKHYRQNGMKADFSWKKTALEYLDVYAKLLHH